MRMKELQIEQFKKELRESQAQVPAPAKDAHAKKLPPRISGNRNFLRSSDEPNSTMST